MTAILPARPGGPWAIGAGERSERVRFPVPEAELERRWAAVRAGMDEAGLDVLLVHDHVDGLGGYVRYLSDMPAAGGYPLSIVFPRHGAMTLVVHGPHGADRAVAPAGDPLLYGVERVLSTWSFASASYTAHDDAAALVGALAPFAGGSIGVLGLAQIPFTLLTHVREHLPRARFGDAADVVDPVKAVKSDWEQSAIAEAVAMQVEAFTAALEAIEPGRREWEVIDAAARVAHAHGSEGGVLMIGSAPAGEPALPNPARNQGRELRDGDRLTLLIEPSGPGGFFAELGRTIVIGAAPDAMHEEHAFAVRAWRACASDLRPGADAATVFAGYNAFLRGHDRPAEERLHCHGQGYDLVERPLVRSDESMTLAAGMVLALHPMYVHAGDAYWVCDNVLIGPDGASAPLHGVEQRIFER